MGAKEPQEGHICFKARAAMRSDQIVQAFSHIDFENLLGWRSHSLSGQSVPVLDCPCHLTVSSKQAKREELKGMDTLIIILWVTVLYVR